ncbi:MULTISPECIES: hypothetical protein [Streptomyces]|nr:hypothetical protein [Streptomyces sp. WAC 01325]
MWDLFEAYLGRRLEVLPDATVRPEMVYGRTHALSVDWTVVTDELVPRS